MVRSFCGIFATLIATALIATTLIAGVLSVSPAAAAEPTRGVWLASVGADAMHSRDGLSRVVDQCSRYGINTIYVVTWNRGVTLYPSQLMQREFGVAIDPKLEGIDPLKELIELAHAKGIRVIAWFEFGFSSSYQRADGGPLLQKRPHWAALDRDGGLVSRNGFQWMNAIDPEVQDFLLAMLKEVVANYDIDGVQGDDRLPAMPNTGGYDPLTLELYRSEHHGNAPPADPRDPAWTQWRADKLSRFVERAYRDLKSLDPDLCVSWAPSVWPWSRDNYLQDWPRWAREGWGDQFCPQVYRKDVESYRRTLEQVVQQVPHGDGPEIVPGMLIALADGYDLADDQLREMVAVNRQLGYEGEVFFYHAGLERHAEVFNTLYAEEIEQQRPLIDRPRAGPAGFGIAK